MYLKISFIKFKLNLFNARFWLTLKLLRLVAKTVLGLNYNTTAYTCIQFQPEDFQAKYGHEWINFDNAPLTWVLFCSHNHLRDDTMWHWLGRRLALYLKYRIGHFKIWDYDFLTLTCSQGSVHTDLICRIGS